MTNNDLHLRSNNTHRPYDRFMGERQLDKARKLRINPDGAEHLIKFKTTAAGKLPIYPWTKLLLGDYFLAPIGTRSIKAMRVSLLQAAARHDLELSVIRMPDGHQIDCLRVTVSAIGIRAIRWKAYLEGYLDKPPSSGVAAKERKREYDRKRRYAAGDVVRQQRKAKAAKHLGDPKHDPFWRDSRQGILDDAKPDQVSAKEVIYTDSSMSREEKSRLALSRLGVK